MHKTKLPVYKYSVFPFLFVILFGFLSCKDSKKDQATLDKDAAKLTDSIAILILKGDSLSLANALVLSDSALVMTTNPKTRIFALQNKAIVLSAQGKKKEAFALQDEIINKDPESIDRLIYNGLKKQNAKNDFEAKALFDSALIQCDKQLTLKPGDVTTFVSKISVYMYMGNKDKALEEINTWLANYPKDEVVLSLKENLDDMFIQTTKTIKEMQGI